MARKNSSRQKTLLGRIRKDRETETGRACVDLAGELIDRKDLVGAEWTSKEARQWIALAITADKFAREGNLAEAEERLEKKRARARRLDGLGGGNVVSLTK